MIGSANANAQSTWQVPQNNVAKEIFTSMSTKECLNWVSYSDQPVSNTIINIGMSEDRLQPMGCYQMGPNKWMALRGSANYEGRIYAASINVIVDGKPLKWYENDKYRIPELEGYYVDAKFYDDHFSVADPNNYKGTVSYYSGYNNLERRASDDYCKYILRHNPNSDRDCFPGHSDDLKSLDPECFDINGNEAVLKNNKCGIMTKETDSTFKAITIGSSMKDAINKPLFVRFDGLNDSQIRVSRGKDAFVVVRNLFMNRYENLAGYVEFSGKSENGKVEGIRIFIEKYDSKDYQVDYTRPILFYSIREDEENGESILELCSFRKYNSQGQVTEYYSMEQDYDSPTLHQIYKVNYSGSNPVVTYISRSDCSLFDLYESPSNVQVGDVTYEQFLEKVAPEKFDSVEKDSQGRITSSKLRNDMENGEFRQWDVKYEYDDDFCIKNVTYSYKTTEWDYESEEPYVMEGVSNYKEKIVYDLIRE